MSQVSQADADGVQVLGNSPVDRDGPHRQVSLVDLLDRLLGTGVVLSGDVVISLAGVDLVQVRLHALISSVRAEMRVAGGSDWLREADRESHGGDESP